MADSLVVSDECSITDVRICADKKLGTGSYGVVYKAFYHGTQVAAKKLHGIFFEGVSPEENKGILQSWFNELQLMNSLRHPNIVQFYGVYNSDDSAGPLLSKNSYIITELMVTSLQARNLEKPRLTIRHIVGIAIDISSGLCYLHNRKNPIMHRDLASKNILLSASGQAKIADLGVAKFTKQVEESHTRHPGTDLYMPFETVIPGGNYDHSVDVYALGVIILEMAISKDPTATQCLKIVGTRVEVVPETERRKNDLSELQNSPKKELEIVILSCLKEKDNRKSATAITKHLQELKMSEIYQSCGITPIFDEVDDSLLKAEKSHSTTQVLDDSMLKAQKEQEFLRKQIATLTQEFKDKLTSLQQHLTEQGEHCEAMQRELQKTQAQNQQLMQYNKELKDKLTSQDAKLKRKYEAMQREFQTMKITPAQVTRQISPHIPHQLSQSQYERSTLNPAKPPLYRSTSNPFEHDLDPQAQNLSSFVATPITSGVPETQDTNTIPSPTHTPVYGHRGAHQLTYGQSKRMHMYNTMSLPSAINRSTSYPVSPLDQQSQHLIAVPVTGLHAIPTPTGSSVFDRGLHGDFRSLPANMGRASMPTVPSITMAEEYLNYQISSMERVIHQLETISPKTSDNLASSFVDTLKEQVEKTTDYIRNLPSNIKTDSNLITCTKKLYQNVDIDVLKLNYIHSKQSGVHDLQKAIKKLQETIKHMHAL